MESIRTDVLIIGGGVAGCFTAIRACELGRSVVILEKATVRRGGSAGPGMDQLNMGVAPEGLNLEQAKEHAFACAKELIDPNMIFRLDKEAYERVLDYEKFGVPLREDDGNYLIWKIPERYQYNISYRGVDTKVKLAEAVKKTKTHVVERTMGVDLIIQDGSVVGAIGLNVRKGKPIAFLSKATILCTGEAGRQYIEPDGLFLTYHPPTNTGDSEAMAYRAGAKLTNMEFIYMDYTTLRAGGGITGMKPRDLMGKLVNRMGESIFKRPDDGARRGFLMVKEIAEGRGPIYWDLRHLPNDVLKHYEREMSNEYPITKDWFKQRRVDIRKDLIPVQMVPTAIIGGLFVDETFRTSVKGLYAAGAATADLISQIYAATSGHIAAESVAKDISKLEEPRLVREQIEGMERQILEPLRRRDGINPIDLERSVRSLVTDYVGYFKSEGMMKSGLQKLMELKEEFLAKLIARNSHELMRCLEVRNIFDMAEMHIRTSLMRKETRLRRVGLYPHYRLDFPTTDPDWEKLIIVRKGDEGMKLSTREVPKFRDE